MSTIGYGYVIDQKDFINAFPEVYSDLDVENVCDDLENFHSLFDDHYEEAFEKYEQTFDIKAKYFKVFIFIRPHGVYDDYKIINLLPPSDTDLNLAKDVFPNLVKVMNHPPQLIFYHSLDD